eukprot:8346045-Pyramimonas_sp.AAC.1
MPEEPEEPEAAICQRPAWRWDSHRGQLQTKFPPKTSSKFIPGEPESDDSYRVRMARSDYQ